MKNSVFVFILPLFFLSFPASYGQAIPDTTTLYRIETTDGNEYLGNILGRDSVELHVKTLNLGVIAFKLKDINKIIQVKKEEIKEGVVWYQVIQSTRYFWSPNGYGLRKGESYYQNIWVMFNQFSGGLTDNFSVGAGLVPLFLFAGSATPVWLTPKFSIPVVENKFNIGIGALTGLVIGEDNPGFGIVYGIGTIGSRDKNLTFGLGYGYAEHSWSDRPIITISGMLRTGKKGYIMSENYIFSFSGERDVLSVIGGRSLIRKSGLDYGLAIPLYSNLSEFVAIPWLGLTIPIESKSQK